MKNWDVADAAALRSVFKKPVVQKMFRNLDLYKPGINAKTFEETSLQANKRMGYELVIELMHGMETFDESPSTINKFVNTDN